MQALRLPYAQREIKTVNRVHMPSVHKQHIVYSNLLNKHVADQMNMRCRAIWLATCICMAGQVLNGHHCTHADCDACIEAYMLLWLS